MCELVRYQPPRPEPDVDGFLWAMYLMFLRAPGKQTAPGEPVDLGEIGTAAEKNWTRDTPYSVVKVENQNQNEVLPLLTHQD